MRNAGLAPIPQGQAGYASHLDRDHDGWACE
ncbi:excalibur calcium-binding domain-containing protein [Streptococcus uberis]